MSDLQADDDHLKAMKRHALERQRFYWLWIGLLPALLSPLGVPILARMSNDWIDVLLLGWIAAIFGWSIFCASKLTNLRRILEPRRASYACATTFLLAIFNALLGTAFGFAACAIMP